MNCQELNYITDSYLADELLVETNHDVLRHLENCAGCRAELAAHRELRMRLRSAVRNSPDSQINAAFRARLTANLRETALRPTFWERVKASQLFNFKSLALAACLLTAATLGVFLLNRPQANQNTAINNPAVSPNIIQPTAEASLPETAFAAWQETAEKAVGDHKNCAIKFRLAEHPITLDQAAEKYGRFNKNLDQVVQASIKESASEKSPLKIEFLAAHSCIFQGRRFAHIVLRYRKSVVSVLVSEPEFPGSGDPAIKSQSQGAIQLAGFHAGNHAVFVVSDLNIDDNMMIAKMIQPYISRHIEQIEA